MSDTPLTDAAQEKYSQWCEYASRYISFPEAQDQAPEEADPFWIARKLERQLTAERAKYKEEIKRLNEEIAAMLRNPPCRECDAMTQEEAETKCNCGGDKDHCHGSDIWTD